jgi:hypothetical protein
VDVAAAASLQPRIRGHGGRAGATALPPACRCHDASQAQPTDAQASPANALLAKAKVSCSDLGRGGPDLRPALAVDAVVAYVSFDARWHERVDRADQAEQAAGLRPHDDGRWRIRPLHLRNATLLI